MFTCLTDTGFNKTPGGKPTVPANAGILAVKAVPVKLNLIPSNCSPTHICCALSEPGKLESDES